jgi:hypothetical protein
MSSGLFHGDAARCVGSRALFGILKPDRLLPFLLGHSRQIICCTVSFFCHLAQTPIIKINEWCERVYTPVQMGTQTIKITCGLTRICCHIGHKPEGIGSPIHDRNTIAGRVIPMVMAQGGCQELVNVVMYGWGTSRESNVQFRFDLRNYGPPVRNQPIITGKYPRQVARGCLAVQLITQPDQQSLEE